MGNYFQPEIETMSREKIRSIQNEKIVKQVKHVYENVKYYRDLMDEKGVTILPRAQQESALSLSTRKTT